MSGDYAHTHGGHRKRMRDRYRVMGLDGFAPHEALELLLFYVIPQRDVNPLAHRLIDAFGSVGGVLSAREEDLTAIAGVGPKTARFLTTVGQACELYASYDDNRIDISKFSSAFNYIERLFEGNERVETWVICMDKTGRLLGAGIVSTDSWFDKCVVRKTLKLALQNHASTLVMIDRRKPADMQVSMRDTEAAINISRSIMRIGILTLDFIIASNEEIVSMRRMKLYDPKLNVKETDDNLARIYLQWLD